MKWGSHSLYLQRSQVYAKLPEPFVLIFSAEVWTLQHNWAYLREHYVQRCRHTWVDSGTSVDWPKYPKITEQEETVDICLLNSPFIKEIPESLLQLCVFAKGKMDLKITSCIDFLPSSPSTWSLGVGDTKILCQLCSGPLYWICEVFCCLF